MTFRLPSLQRQRRIWFKYLLSSWYVIQDGGIRALVSAIKRHFGEETIKEYEIAFDVLNAERKPGIMIDVGAHIGEASAKFAYSGWRVVAFEPEDGNRQRLSSLLGGLPNVVIDGRAVSDTMEQNAIFYKSDSLSGIGSLSPFHSTHRPGGHVEVITLKYFFETTDTFMPIDNVDFLKVDTEGYDLHVLRGWPWAKFRPRLILCEFENAKTAPLGYKFEDIAQFLSGQGYKIIISEWYPLVAYGAVHRWRRFARYPCALKDNDGWGNIFATRDDTVYNTLIDVCGLR